MEGLIKILLREGLIKEDVMFYLLAEETKELGFSNMDETFNLIEGLVDEDYPSSWNIEEFKTLTSFNARIKYCEEHLQRISSGSSRIVYKIDNEKVLKLAKNKKGLAQNGVEIQYSNESNLDDVLAKIYEYDENNLWVEMELAKKLRVADFHQITGFKFKDYAIAINNYGNDVDPRINRGKMDIDKELVEQMWEDEFVYGMFQYIGDYGLPVGDLMRLNTYGIVKGDGEQRIVVIDYGLDNDVYTSYYS